MTCPLPISIPECEKCVHAECNDVCNECATNNQCLSYVACTSFCADEACVQQCKDTYPQGVDVGEAFLGPKGCVPKRCAKECSSEQ